MNKLILFVFNFVVLTAFGATLKDQYCNISTDNTMCKYDPSVYGSKCQKVYPMAISAGDKQLIVDVHNKYRRNVAKGLEKRGAPGPQPAASNIRELTWDDELAVMAQTHVQQCVFEHDKNRNVPRFAVGQNLAIQFSTSLFAKSSWEAMIQSWYDEVAAFNPQSIASFPSSPGAVIGHYTQLVWAETYKVGCGMVGYYDNSTATMMPNLPYKLMYACNYGPAGNFIGTRIYGLGSAASACPSGTVAKDGLCA